MNLFTPEVTVTRPRNRYVDFFRAYRILVDDEEVARIRRGRTVTFRIPEGTHRIRAKIDWCGSNEITFEAREGDKLAFVCRNDVPAMQISTYISEKPGEYLTMEQI